MAKQIRKKGEGSLYYSEIKGLWIYQYVDEGKRKKVTHKNKNILMEKIDDIRAEIRQRKEFEEYEEYGFIFSTIPEILKQDEKNKLEKNQIQKSTYARHLETIKIIEKHKILRA